MPWILTAALAPPLVHDTDASDAVERALEAGVQDPLEPMSLDAIRAHDPWSRNGQPIAVCSPGHIDAKAVRGHLLYRELDAARERLAAERVRCAGTREERAELERAAGLLALADGDEPKAATAFAVAKGYDPDVPWDDGFPTEQHALFDAAEPLAATLLVVPTPKEVDGGPPVPGPWAAGPHGLAVGATAIYFRHGDIDDVLAVPSAHPPELPPMADEAARVQLTHVLSAALGEGTRVHVAAPDALWTGTTGRTDWTAIPWPTVATPEPLPTAAPEPKRRPVPWHVAGAGAVVAAGGGLLAGVSNAQAQGLADDMSGATERGPYDELATRAGGANDRMRIGQGLLAGGAGIATVGVVWGVVR